MVTDPALVGQSCELDILKEAFDPPPDTTPYGPALPLDAVVGTKVRALASRGLPRDLIDIHAASWIRSNAELEALGQRYARDDEFSLVGSRTVWTVQSGTTTRHSPNTVSRQRTSPACADGHRHGPTILDSGYTFRPWTRKSCLDL